MSLGMKITCLHDYFFAWWHQGRQDQTATLYLFIYLSIAEVHPIFDVVRVVNLRAQYQISTFAFRLQPFAYIGMPPVPLYQRTFKQTISLLSFSLIDFHATLYWSSTRNFNSLPNGTSIECKKEVHQSATRLANGLPFSSSKYNAQLITLQKPF